jgi:hypothetical protein
VSQTTGIEIIEYPCDVRIHVHRPRNSSPPSPSIRGRVTEFSDKSRNQFRFVLNNASVEWRAWLGLTYPKDFPIDGQVCKSHLNKFLIYVKRVWGVKHYAWAFEFQTRGAPHVHLLVDEFVDKEWVSKTWFEIVGSGDLKHLHSGTRVTAVYGRDKGISYMLREYGAKKEQKEVPPGFQNVGRFWGTSRGLVVPSRETMLAISPESVQLVRTLRRYTEKHLKVKRLRPMREDHSRKRFVRREQELAHLHTGLNGFAVFGGSNVCARLLDGIDDLNLFW